MNVNLEITYQYCVFIEPFKAVYLIVATEYACLNNAASTVENPLMMQGHTYAQSNRRLSGAKPDCLSVSVKYMQHRLVGRYALPADLRNYSPN